MSRNTTNLHRRSRTARSGVAAVEVIPCLMILMLLTFGTIELCSGFFIKQSVTIAAFEGVRGGVRRGTDNQDIIDRAQAILDFRGIDYSAPSYAPNSDDGSGEPSADDYGIFVVTPGGADVEDLDALDPITVRIVVSSENNATPIFKHLLRRQISASVTMVREFDPPFVPPGS